MKLQPHVLRAASLWAEAQYAESVRQWSLAHTLYRRALAIYEAVYEPFATFRVYRRLCLLAKAQGNWAEMSDYIRMMLKCGKRSIFGRESDLWLRVGQAERGCQHIDAARHALIQCVRMSEASLIGFQIDAEDTGRMADGWTPEMGVYAEGLYEWGLLEATCGAVMDGIGLLTLGEHVLMRAEPFTVLLIPDERREIAHLRQAITSDRIRLQKQIEGQP